MSNSTTHDDFACFSVGECKCDDWRLEKQTWNQYRLWLNYVIMEQRLFVQFSKRVSQQQNVAFPWNCTLHILGARELQNERIEL